MYLCVSASLRWRVRVYERVVCDRVTDTHLSRHGPISSHELAQGENQCVVVREMEDEDGLGVHEVEPELPPVVLNSALVIRLADLEVSSTPCYGH